MARYQLVWDNDDRTLDIYDEDSKPKGKVVDTLVYFAEGEVPDSASHPQPNQHLDNLAYRLGVKPAEMTVRNKTQNDRLDRFEREGQVQNVRSNDSQEQAESTMSEKEINRADAARENTLQDNPDATVIEGESENDSKSGKTTTKGKGKAKADA